MGLKFWIEKNVFKFKLGSSDLVRRRSNPSLELFEEARLVLGTQLWDKVECVPELQFSIDQIHKLQDALRNLDSKGASGVSANSQTPEDNSQAGSSRASVVNSELKTLADKKDALIADLNDYLAESGAEFDIEVVRKKKADIALADNELTELKAEAVALQKADLEIGKSQQVQDVKTCGKDVLEFKLREEFRNVGRFIHHHQMSSPAVVEFFDRNKRFEKQLKKLGKSIRYDAALSEALR